MKKKVLVIGSGDIGEEIHRVLLNSEEFGDVVLLPRYGMELVIFRNRIRDALFENDPDVVVNALGVFDFSIIPDDDFYRQSKMFDNIFTANVFLPWWIANKFCLINESVIGWKCLVNIGSESSFIPHSNSSLYCSSKAALSMLTKCLDKDLRKDNFCVFQVNPGIVRDTKMGNAVCKDFGIVTKDELAFFIYELLLMPPAQLAGKEFNIGCSEEYMTIKKSEYDSLVGNTNSLARKL